MGFSETIKSAGSPSSVGREMPPGSSSLMKTAGAPPYSVTLDEKPGTAFSATADNMAAHN
jgi:hypothetical protein